MKNLKYIMLVLGFIILMASYSHALQIKAYFFGDKKNISAPFPDTPRFLKGPYKETYMYEDLKFFNQYQFFFNIVENMPSGIEQHLKRISQERVKALNGRIIYSNFDKTTTGGRLRYLYSYKKDGLDIDSSVITEISGNEYFSWSVQSFKGHSRYSSEQIVNQYVKHFGKNTSNCR